MNWKKIRAVSSYVASNTFFIVCLYLWFHDNIPWAGNFVLFWVWCAFIVSALALFNQQAITDLREKGPSIPLWMNAVIDISCAFYMACMGHFWMAAGYIIQCIMNYEIYREPK